MSVACRVFLGWCVLTAIPPVTLADTPVNGPVIEVLVGSTGDATCSADGALLKCRDVGNFLRETRQLPVTTEVHIRATTRVKFEDAQALMTALDRAGYRSLAFLTQMPRDVTTPK